MKSIKELGILSTDAYQQASYWNHHGAYQEQYEQLAEKLIPIKGAADTVHGELIRGIGRLFYEYCNNGNGNAAQAITPSDHAEDFRDYDPDDIDWDEVEEVTINPYYEKFLSLIDTSLSDTILPDEVHRLTNAVRDIIRGACADNLRVCEYYREDNVNRYNALCDAVIWYVMNSFDRPLPSGYKRA